MKKIVVLLLLMVSTSVMAEWTKVTNSYSHGGYSVYINFDTIKRKGNKVKMWTLYDFETFQKRVNYSYLSLVSRQEYDCAEENSRILDEYEYSRNMRSGDVVFSQTNMNIEKESIVPDSVVEGLFEIACDKK